VAEPVGREPDLRLTRAHGRGGDAHHSAVNPPPRSPVGSMSAELGHWCAGGHTDEVKLGRFMGTEIFVIDADTDTDVSRRLRRLGATVIAVPSLSARDLPSAYDGKRPDLRPACTTRPDRRRSHLHVRSSRAVVRGPDAAEAATMLTRRDRTAATISYDLNIAAVAKGRLSPADLTSIESMIGCSDIVTLSEGDLKSLRPGERHADAVRWLMARGPAIIAVTNGMGGYVGYVRGGSVPSHGCRAADVGATHGVSEKLTAGLLYALDERDLLGAGAHEALRGIGLREVNDVFSDANRYGASASSPLGSALTTPATQRPRACGRKSCWERSRHTHPVCVARWAGRAHSHACRARDALPPPF